MLGCRVRSGPPAASPSGSPPSTMTAAVRDTVFTDVAARSGISFHHSPGAHPAPLTRLRRVPARPLTILQTAGAGCAFFDFDNDGWLDVFLVGSARARAGAPLHALYRNNHDGAFTDVTAAAGLTGSGYGMGCVA